MSRRLNKEWKDLEKNPDALDRFFGLTRSIERGEHVWTTTFVIDDIQSTAYRNSIIHVKLVFPQEYPFKPPEIYFKTPVHHPYVSGSDGKLCECILKQFFRNSDMATVTTRDILEYLYLIIISDGSLLDDENICIDRFIQDTRDNDYLLFDSIIQRILGNELPEDTEVDDRVDTTYSQINEWDVEVKIQRSYNAIRRAIVTRLFNGKFEGIRINLNRLLGLEQGIKFKGNPKLFEEYIFPADEEKEGSITVTTASIVEEDGQEKQKTITMKLFKCFTTFEGLSSDKDEYTLHIPYSYEAINVVNGMCGAKKGISFRIYNPTTTSDPNKTYHTDKDLLKKLVEPFAGYDLKQTFEIIKAADFLGADRITTIGCLHLSYLIKRKSRVLKRKLSEKNNDATSADRKRKIEKALFKTHVLNF